VSVTGHNPVRRADDFYATPGWCVRAILPHLMNVVGRMVIDPCAGKGDVLDVVGREWPHVRRAGLEIDGTRAQIAGVCHPVVHRDALAAESWSAEPGSLVLTNPPFSLAMEFVHRSLDEVRAYDGTVAMLLRLGWLASLKRAEWLRRNTPSVFVLPRRPSFTGTGTDSADYAWMVWGPSAQTPVVKILSVDGLR
jgi:hypothetical protein